MKSNILSIRPKLGGLPPVTPCRRVVRRLLKGLSQCLVWLCTHPEVHGLENFPKQGPVLIVINHLGDADAVLGLANAPAPSLLSRRLAIFSDSIPTPTSW